MNNTTELELVEDNENVAPNLSVDLMKPLVNRNRMVNEEKIFIIKRIMNEKPVDNNLVNLVLIFSILIINQISQGGLVDSFIEMNYKIGVLDKDLETLLPIIYINCIVLALFALLAGIKNILGSLICLPFFILFFLGFFVDYDGILRITLYSSVITSIGTIMNFRYIQLFEDFQGNENEYSRKSYIQVFKLTSTIGYITLYVVLTKLIFVSFCKEKNSALCKALSIYTILKCFFDILGVRVLEPTSFVTRSMISMILALTNVGFSLLLWKMSSTPARIPPNHQKTFYQEFIDITNIRFLIISLTWGIMFGIYTCWLYMLDKDIFHNMFCLEQEDLNDFYYKYVIKSTPYIGGIGIGIYSYFFLTKIKSKTPTLIFASFITGFLDLIILYVVLRKYIYFLT